MLHVSEKRRKGHVTSGGWERTIGEAQSVPSNIGERKRLHTSETFHLPTVGVSLHIGNRF